MKAREDSKRNGTAKRDLRRRVIIVDDHPLVRQGLVAVIDQQADLTVSGEAASAAEAMAALEAGRPDVMVIDIGLQESNGIELIKSMHAIRPGLPLLALSMHDETVYAERALRAGALGYVMKQERVEIVLAAIRKVLEGSLWVSERVSGSLLRGLVLAPKSDTPKIGVERLSDRELEVFEAIGAGLSTREIADKLRLGIKTVETHRAAIKSKLQLKTGVELVQRATLWVARSDR